MKSLKSLNWKPLNFSNMKQELGELDPAVYEEAEATLKSATRKPRLKFVGTADGSLGNNPEEIADFLESNFPDISVELSRGKFTISGATKIADISIKGDKDSWFSVLYSTESEDGRTYFIEQVEGSEITIYM